MSLLHMEGWELMGSTADASALIQARAILRWPGSVTHQGNGVDLVDNDQADGGKALRWGTAPSAESNSIIFPVSDQAGKTMVIGARIKLNSNATSDSAAITARGVLTDQLHLEFQNNANIRLMRGFTEVANVASVLTAGAWHYIEWEFSVHNSTGHTKVWVDGTEQMNETAKDTQNGSTDTIDQIEINGLESVSAGDFAATDDIYILNTDGAAPLNARLGNNTRIVGKLPINDGLTNDWTPSSAVDHYTLVDENPEGTTDYVESSTSTEKELFGYASAPDNTIYAVEIEAICRSDGVGISNFRGRVESNASSAVGGTEAVASEEDDTVIRAIFTEDPDTSAAWIQAGVNNAEFGLEIV